MSKLRVLKTFSFSLLLLLFFSCASETKLSILARNEQMIRSRSDFNGYLALEYLQLSRNLLNNKSEKDSEYFAAKAIAVSQNSEYIPENPLNWNADKSQVEEIIAMQRRLEDVITPSLKNNLPIQLAHLSYLYDCWAAKESQPIFRAAELAKCRERFYKLLNEVEYYVEDLRKDKTPKTVIIEPEFKKFEIFFDLNSNKFNDKANKDLIVILKYLIDLQGDFRLLLVGNSDRSGKELYNQNLAFRRVQTVKNYIIKNGVDSNLVEIRSYGEDFPDILTSDGITNQKNRSVGIYVLRGANSFQEFPLPLIENIIYKQGVKSARKKRGLLN